MSYVKNRISKILLLLIMAVFIGVLTGCTGGTDVNYDDLYTVIYDGNGGYLGNKTSTVRKLQVAEGSKIPKYFQEYTQDSYVVSSLGLATRQGYNLKGWYLESNAQYAPNPLGTYVFLDLEAGNGTYKIDDEGLYVYGYVVDTEGTLVFINVEELSEDDDPNTAEYIYFNGSNGYGFYVYDSEDAAHVDIYEVDGGYAPSELSAFGSSYLVLSELSTEWQTLFVDVPKYKQAFYEYTEADEGLTRYNFESGYVYFESMFVEDEMGEYVIVDGIYVTFDSENPAHDELTRYNIDDRYVFTPSVTYASPSDLPRFNASITYWDFESNRVTEDITLIAHWERKLTVNYIQKSGQVTVITKKLTEDNTSSVDLVAGEVIGKLETIPLFSGYTFVAWSKSETEFDPWDFETDVFPTDATELNLYAYMIEGVYTRITSASGLAKVALNPSGNYVLVTDIDFEGQVFSNSSPLGFTLKTAVNTTIVPFTGIFDAMGYKLSNFTLAVQNTQKNVLADAGIVVVSALFPYVQNATISNVILENVSAVLTTSAGATSTVCDLGAAALIGTALDGNTVVTNVDVDITVTATTADVIGYPVYVGDVVARGEEFVTITESTATLDYSAITGITSDTLYVSELN
ncbi:MAG: hypothetical protein CVV56_07755 [Tenericutes bacterium HGW-Tenericutes-1]|jgi:hypothetical protein|nr:MAG: hypothetical protein CVV56_07755 [Tenericutes bacterium HGW-Tenericutes-1]